MSKNRNEVGGTAIEYALLASLISIITIGGMFFLRLNISKPFCTISSYIGGSNGCDGNNNSSSEDKYEMPKNITTKDELKKLQDALIDTLDLDNVDNSLGGNEACGSSGSLDVSCGFWNMNDITITKGITAYWLDSLSLTGKVLSATASNMADINAKDPISNVFGVYNNDGTPNTSYDSFVENSNKNSVTTGWVKNNDTKGTTTYISFTTQSGKVYTSDENGDIKEASSK